MPRVPRRHLRMRRAHPGARKAMGHRRRASAHPRRCRNWSVRVGPMVMPPLVRQRSACAGRERCSGGAAGPYHQGSPVRQTATRRRIDVCAQGLQHPRQPSVPPHEVFIAPPGARRLSNSICSGQSIGPNLLLGRFLWIDHARSGAAGRVLLSGHTQRRAMRTRPMRNKNLRKLTLKSACESS